MCMCAYVAGKERYSVCVCVRERELRVCVWVCVCKSVSVYVCGKEGETWAQSYKTFRHLFRRLAQSYYQV